MSVAQLFAEQIQKDLVALKEGKTSELSLAAKWAPTPKRESCASARPIVLFSKLIL